MFGGIRRLFSRLGATALVLVFFVGMGLALTSVPLIAYAEEYKPAGSTLPSVAINLIGDTLAQIIDFLGNAVGSLTLVIIEVVVVNVLNYNNFSNSNIVTLGWTITRDMVNMVAVIVLLILAVKTMIGQTANAWQQHLPRFFLGIVFANFSRTLLGLVVDASQIVMMTFVNALMSIAAGNFAQLLVMPQATTYSVPTLERATNAGEQLITLGANIANAYVKLLVQVTVMVVMLLLAIAFIWRIVMLWIAFIMAPLAGFSWGAKEIVGFLARVWQEWIGATVPPLVLGPMLSFFLYLALAASSNGNLAKTQAFPEPEKRTTYGQITLEVFESTNFTGLLIAIVFLLLGLQQSAKVASKMGGLASMMLNEKTAGRVLRAGGYVAGKTVGSAAKITTRGALKAGGLVGAGLQLGANKLTSGRSDILSKGVRLGGAVMGGLGTVASAADKQVGLIPTNVMDMPGYAKNRGAAIAKGAGNLATKAGTNMARGVGFVAGGAEKLGSAIARGANASPENVEKFGGMLKNATAAGLLSLPLPLGANAMLKTGSFLGAQEHHISEAEEKAAKERVSHMTQDERAERLRQALQGIGEKSVEASADASHLKGLLLKDKKFNDTFKESIGPDEYEKSMKQIFRDLQHEDEAGHLSIEKETWDKARSKYADIFVAAAGQDNAKKFFASKEFDIKSIRDSGIKEPGLLFALAATQTGDKKDGKFITRFDQMSDRQKDQASGASQKMYEAFNKMDNFSQDSMRAFSRLEGNASTLDADTALQIRTRLAAIERNSAKEGFAESEIAAIKKNLVASGHQSLKDVYGGEVYNPTTFEVKNRKNFKELVGDDMSVLHQVDDVALDDAAKDSAKTVFEGLSKESIEKMKDMVQSGARSRGVVEDALKKVTIVLDAFEKKAMNGVTREDLKEIQEQIKAAGEAVKKAESPDDKELHQKKQEALAVRHKALVDQMDIDALVKIKGLRSSQEATKRYL